MKNWRRILVTGLVAGMVMFTGCSSNLPETNQGNRNGQRVVDAVNRRTDTYETTRGRNIGADRSGRTTRGLRGFNRGLRRTARTDGVIRRNDGTARHSTAARHDGVTRHNNRHDGITRHNTTTRGNHRNHRTGTGIYTHPRTDGIARNTPNRSTATPHRGRVGHTFGYSPTGYAHGFDGYDLGQYAGDPYSSYMINAGHNTATVNNRVVRSTATSPRPTRNMAHRTTGTTATRKVTPAAPKTNVTRSTVTAAPKTNVTRSTTPAAPKTNVTRSTTPAAPKTNVTRSTTPATPKSNVTRSTTPAAPKSNVTRSARPATPRPAHTTRSIRSTQHKNHPASKNTRTGRRVANRIKHENTARTRSRVAHPAIPNVNNARPIQSVAPYQPKVVAGQTARPTTRSNAQSRTERARGHYTNAGIHHMQNITNPIPGNTITRSTVNNRKHNTGNVQNRKERRINTPSTHRANRANRLATNRPKSTMTKQYNVHEIDRNIHNVPHPSSDVRHDLSQTVTVFAPNVDSAFFFKRNKPDKTETPATPTPAVPQAPNRGNRVTPPSSQTAPVPAPAVTPAPVAPTSMEVFSYDYNPNIRNIGTRAYYHQGRLYEIGPNGNYSRDRIHDVGPGNHNRDRTHDVAPGVNYSRDRIHDVGPSGNYNRNRTHDVAPGVNYSRDRIHDVGPNGIYYRDRIHDVGPGGHHNHEHFHNIDGENNIDYYEGQYNNQLKPLPKSDQGKPTSAKRVGHRAMK